MLAVLCSAPRPPLGVALLGLLITAISSTLRLLPYITLCSIIVLSIWVPSRPADPEVMYYPVDGHPQHVHVVYASPPMDGSGTSELNACLRILFILFSIPATAILENTLFRPTRELFLQTVETWFEMRYVQPVLATGSWPDTWTPILNALRSFQFVADFIDGVTGSNSSLSLPHEKNARPAGMQPSTPGCDIGERGGAVPQTRPAMRNPSSSCRTVHWKYQRKPDRKHTPSPYSVIQSKVADSSDISFARRTFISHPLASRTSYPISRDLSRMIGVFFRHPSPLKPTPRPRFNIDTKALSARATNVKLECLSFSAPSAPISPLKASTCDSVISCPDFMKTSERVEQTQLTKSSDTLRLSHVPQREEPQILMRPWRSVPGFQQERPIQQQRTQFAALNTAQCQEHYIPVYESKLMVSAPSNDSELSMHRLQLTRDHMASDQQQLSEHMDIDLDFSPSLMHRPEQYAPSLGSAVPTCPPFHLPQDRFTSALQPQFSNAAPEFSSSGHSLSYGPPVLQCISALPITDRREELFPPSPQCMPPSERFPTGPCAPKWTTSYSPLAMGTETFSFIVDPDTATPHFAFSQQPAGATSTWSGYTECVSPGDMSLDGNHVSQTVSVDYAPTQLIDQNARSPETLPVPFDHQPEVVPQPTPPVNPLKSKADDKKDNGSSSDSDTSDSDYTESSEDSSDSDDSSSSEEDEEDASAPVAGPSKVDKGKGKAP